MSTVDSVEVVVKANSKGAFPKRGVLLHYKSELQILPNYNNIMYCNKVIIIILMFS